MQTSCVDDLITNGLCMGCPGWGVLKLMATPLERSKSGEVHDATNRTTPATDGNGAAAPVQVSLKNASSRG